MYTLRCDILILGAGPAGMAAALAAAACDKQVIILDDNPAPGGQIWRAGSQATLPALARRYRDAIAASAAIRVVERRAADCRPAPARSVLFETADGGGVVYWQKLILCCGARELSLPFPGWTLPGVTSAGAAGADQTWLVAERRKSGDCRQRPAAAGGGGYGEQGRRPGNEYR